MYTGMSSDSCRQDRDELSRQLAVLIITEEAVRLLTAFLYSSVMLSNDARRESGKSLYLRG